MCVQLSPPTVVAIRWTGSKPQSAALALIAAPPVPLYPAGRGGSRFLGRAALLCLSLYLAHCLGVWQLQAGAGREARSSHTACTHLIVVAACRQPLMHHAPPGTGAAGWPCPLHVPLPAPAARFAPSAGRRGGGQARHRQAPPCLSRGWTAAACAQRLLLRLTPTPCLPRHLHCRLIEALLGFRAGRACRLLRRPVLQAPGPAALD
jgi:hypothetical protein